jgi:hypothetical protein
VADEGSNAPVVGLAMIQPDITRPAEFQAGWRGTVQIRSVQVSLSDRKYFKSLSSVYWKRGCGHWNGRARACGREHDCVRGFRVHPPARGCSEDSRQER